MSDLFQIPESPLPPLEAARRRLASAQEEYQKADAWCDDTGEQIPFFITKELNEAHLAVQRLEQEALRNERA